MPQTSLPRWTLAVLCTFVAALCGWAATVLPWSSWTLFATLTTIVGVTHGITALLALVGSDLRGKAWRIQSLVAFVYLGWLTWNLVTSASTIAALYGGLGRGVAVALGLGWCLAAPGPVPPGAWG